MAYAEHKVPAPLKDEDKWFGFTKRQWIIMAPAIGVVVFIVKATKSLHILPVGISLSVIILLMGAVMAFLELPPDKYIYGSGVKMERILLRYVKKRLPKYKVIYTKNLSDGYREWGSKL